MIARIWHGKTTIDNYDAYADFLQKVAVPDYKNCPGFKSLRFLKRIEKGEGHFTLITYWENLEVIKNFAGKDYEKAKYYPEDENFLLEFEEKVQHFDVFAD
ncbi:MAG: antibiotic biosynthesis monooxygenase [Saonia sp.]